MKKLAVFLCSVALVFGVAGLAGATALDFDVAGSPNSSVILSDISTGIFGFGTHTGINASLADGLGNLTFSLNDSESQAFNFIKFVVSGNGIGSFDISATLAFDAPIGLSADFSGSGGWGTLNLGWFGTYSGGLLSWNDPDQSITLSDGNIVNIALQQGIALGSGNSTFLQATVTNLGGGTAPVPEPATMLLLGTGLVGLVAVNRKRLLKKD